MNPEILSCGGYNPENEKNPDTYTEHVVSAMKALGRTMTSLSESVSGSNLSVHSKDIVHGVVSVVDLSKEVGFCFLIKTRILKNLLNQKWLGI